VWGRRNSLKRFLSFVDRHANTHHAEDVPRVLKPSPRTVICSAEDFHKLIDLSPVWFRCFLMLCRYLGLRHNEARSLTPREWNPEERAITIHRKGQSVSTLPLPDELEPMFSLAASISLDEPVIRSLGWRHQSAHSLTNWWHSIKKKAGVDPQLNVHDLRRTVATALYDRTHDLRAVQQLLGHKRMDSTLYYIAPRDPEYLRGLLAELHPFNLAKAKPATEVKQ
jgi:integrase